MERAQLEGKVLRKDGKKLDQVVYLQLKNLLENSPFQQKLVQWRLIRR